MLLLLHKKAGKGMGGYNEGTQTSSAGGTVRDIA
jgi:hypothetical protein